VKTALAVMVKLIKLHKTNDQPFIVLNVRNR